MAVDEAPVPAVSIVAPNGACPEGVPRMVLAANEQVLVCQDCAESYVFSIAEQAFYAERGVRQPARCPNCRAKRRAERNSDIIKAHDSAVTTLWQEGFGNYGGSGGSALNGKSRRGSRIGAARFSFPAVCTHCRCDTEVPFPPRPGRPVYCRKCFETRRGN